ncbi:MAG: hypothetical protein AAGA29_08675 [Planctomycetota bacterium]
MNPKLQRLWRQMTADKKRFGIMCTALAVGLLLWGRLVLLRDVPRYATAEPDMPDIDDVMGETPAGSGTARPQRSGERLTVALDLPDTLTLDLFELRPDRYKLTPDPDSTEDGLQEDTGPADELRQRDALMDAARDLTLQGVVRGSPSFAVINGVRVYVGGRISGFVLTGLSHQERKAHLTSELFEDLVVILKMSDG